MSNWLRISIPYWCMSSLIGLTFGRALRHDDPLLLAFCGASWLGLMLTYAIVMVMQP